MSNHTSTMGVTTSMEVATEKHEGFSHLTKAGLRKVADDLAAEVARLQAIIAAPGQWTNGSALLANGITLDTEHGTFHLSTAGVILHTPDGQIITGEVGQ